MAVFIGDYARVATITDTASLNLDEPAAPAFAMVGDKTFVYVSSYDSDEGIEVFEMAPSGALTHLPGHYVASTGTVPLEEGNTPHIFEIGGQQFLAYAGYESDNLVIYRINPDGKLTRTDFYDDNGTSKFETPYHGALSYVRDGKTFLVVSGSGDDGFSVFQVSSSGKLTLTDSKTTSDLEEADGFAITEIGGKTYLVISGFDSDSVLSYELSSTGKATKIDQIDDTAGLELEGPADIAIVKIDGKTYAVVAGYSDDGLQVLRINANGTLTAVFALEDSDLPTGTPDLLIEPWGVEAVVIDGVPFVSVSGYDSDSISLYSVSEDGTLTLMQYDEPLPYATFQSALIKDGKAFVALGTEDDVFYNFSLGASDDTYTGTSGADTMVGLDGEDAFDAGDGNDVFYGGAGGDSADGKDGQDTLYGGQGNDTLNGNANGDTLYGDEGRDLLYGGGGPDTIFGGDGRDNIKGGIGSDWLFGGEGIDNLKGDSGNPVSARAGDFLFGGGGGTSKANADKLDGNEGSDIIYGDGLDDIDAVKALSMKELREGKGNDTGVGGVDIMTGGGGDDFIFGGGGSYDRLNGGNGSDTMTGGGGQDGFRFVNQGSINHFRSQDHDRITDFKIGQDVLELKGNLPNFSNATFENKSGDLLITLGNGYRLTMDDLGGFADDLTNSLNALNQISDII